MDLDIDQEDKNTEVAERSDQEVVFHSKKNIRFKTL